MENELAVTSGGAVAGGSTVSDVSVPFESVTFITAGAGAGAGAGVETIVA
jgi:hypothetical protein